MPPSDKGNWVGTSKRSLFAYFPHDFPPGVNHSRKIPLTRYCQEKFITKDQARTLVRKKWLAITKFRNQIWVQEICPDEINEFLSG
jgi:hypothetical protein